MPPLLISWNSKRPIVLFKVIPAVLECDCVAERAAKAKISMSLTHPLGRREPLQMLLSHKCISHAIKVIGYLDIGHLCPSNNP